jgi:hypothetical protein
MYNLCQICKHACRQHIEEAVLQWRSPKVIMHCFGIKTETTIYHHAHALGLFRRRNQNLSQALANVIEEVDTVRPTTRDILRAVYPPRSHQRSRPVDPSHQQVRGRGFQQAPALGTLEIVRRSCLGSRLGGRHSSLVTASINR